MSTSFRQSVLFVSEQWERAYEALTRVDFRAYDQDTLRRAMLDYVRTTYPEEFDDWIGSSEFVIKVDILAWLSQNVSWRVDLGGRESFISVAERRDSILRLAENVLYSASRVRGATGEVKVTAVRSTQRLVDIDGQAIDRVKWGDNTDPDWQEKWNTVWNAALSGRNPIGRPTKRYSDGSAVVSLYRMNSLAPPTGVYSFSSSIGGQSLQFEISNCDMQAEDGRLFEYAPSPGNPFHVLYRADGRGASSPGTGFFLPVRQGEMRHYDVDLSVPVAGRSIVVPAKNVSQTDVWVMETDADGRRVAEWTRADDPGFSLGYYPLEERRIYEVISGTDDSISIRFGDGKYGSIPKGLFRIWYRTVSPLAPIVRISDIKDRQVTIPYASNGRVYSLTVWFDLAYDMTDAGPSEADSDVKYRASKVFYAQNRMVNAEDYNSYVLKDNSILKAVSVNRTYSGHGVSARMSDPTGVSSSVRIQAQDGRFYKQFTTEVATFSADTSVLSSTDLVDLDLAGAIANSEGSTLYYNESPEIPVGQKTWFSSSSVVNGRSRGTLKRDPVEPYDTPIGSDADADDPLRAIGADSLLRFGGYRGQVARIDYVTGNGTGGGLVVMKDLVPDGAVLYSVMAGYRTELTDDERAAVLFQVGLKRSFALRWDGPTASWNVVLSENIGSGSFSIDGAGDDTGAGLDRSWTVKLEYRTIPDAADEWELTRRGLQLRFESDRDVRFYHAGGTLVVDAETGRPLRDSIRILRTNESRDSLNRLGLEPTFGIDPNSGAVVLVGDGETTEFGLGAEFADERGVFCFLEGNVYPSTQFTVLHVPGRDRIRFAEAIPEGQRMTVRHDQRLRHLDVSARETVGDDAALEWDLGTRDLVPDNVFAFVDGEFVSSFGGLTVFRGQSGTDVIRFSAVPGTSDEVHIKACHGSGPAFASIVHTGTGSQSTFKTNARTDQLWVFVDGLLRTDYQLNRADPENFTVVLASPPALNARIEIKILLFPELCSVKKMEVLTTSATDSLDLTSLGVDDGSASRVLVWIDGAMKGWSFEGRYAFFDDVLPIGSRVAVTFFEQLGSYTSGFSQIVAGPYRAVPSYIDREKVLLVTGNISHDDGYTNQNGVTVTDEDADSGGDGDDPFVFRELVLQDGQDLVVWRRVTQRGADVWDPIGESTVPRATVQSARWSFSAGEAVQSPTRSGDVHYRSGQFLVADAATGEWIVAGDQSAYKVEIGRGSLAFVWEHIAPEENRIDASPTNVIDIFVLTTAYDRAVRDWARLNRPEADYPAPETTVSLRSAYSALEAAKMISDAVVWRPVRHKPLFGPRSAAELRAKILVVRAFGAAINDQDLKLRVLDSIDAFLDPRVWNPGETFYFTELAAFIHRQLPTIVRSVVVVPRAGDGTFGRIFQVRAEPDEMFVSCAVPSDIEIVESLTDSSLNIL